MRVVPPVRQPYLYGSQKPLAFLFIVILCQYISTSGYASPDQSSRKAAITSNSDEAIALFREAVKIVNEKKDLVKAASLYKRTCELDPSCAAFHNNYGLVLLNLDQSDAAKEEFLKAIALHKDFAPPWDNLGTIFEKKGQLDDAAAALKEYLRLEPNKTCGNAEDARYHLKCIEQTRQSGSSVDYYAILTDGQRVRWSKSKMPLKVYIESGQGIPDFKPQYQNIVHQAFANWSAVSDGKLSFTFISEKNNADIITKWCSDPHTFNSLVQSGETDWHATFGSDRSMLNKVIITILIADPLPYVKISDTIVRQLALHEVGHAIGILGHSPDPNDVMFFSAKSYLASPQISNRDKNTLLKLYESDR